MLAEHGVLDLHQIGVADVAVPRGEVTVPEQRQAFLGWSGRAGHTLDPPALKRRVHPPVLRVCCNAHPSELVEGLLVLLPTGFHRFLPLFRGRDTDDVRVQICGVEVTQRHPLVINQLGNGLVQALGMPLRQFLRGGTVTRPNQQVSGLGGAKFIRTDGAE